MSYMQIKELWGILPLQPGPTIGDTFLEWRDCYVLLNIHTRYSMGGFVVSLARAYSSLKSFIWYVARYYILCFMPATRIRVPSCARRQFRTSHMNIVNLTGFGITYLGRRNLNEFDWTISCHCQHHSEHVKVEKGRMYGKGVVSPGLYHLHRQHCNFFFLWSLLFRAPI